MPAQDYYTTNMQPVTINISETNREFQTSIILKQDENKTGILSFLTQLEETIMPPPPTRAAPQTVRPRRNGGY